MAARPIPARKWPPSPADRHDGDDPVLVAWQSGPCFPVPLSAFDDLIDGCEMDVHGERYRTFDDLVGYCRRVAGSIGRLASGSTAPAPQRALRLPTPLAWPCRSPTSSGDVIEDRDQMGRVYLPDDRERFGRAPDLRRDLDAIMALVSFEAARAEDGTRRGWPCCPCSTDGPGRAPPPWPVSTADFWSASARPRRRAQGRLRCPAGKAAVRRALVRGAA